MPEDLILHGDVILPEDNAAAAAAKDSRILPARRQIQVTPYGRTGGNSGSFRKRHRKNGRLFKQ